jgi:6-phosphogluconolactonase
MKSIISLIIVMCFAHLAQGQANTKYKLLIGTYSSISNDGIFCYDFNSQTGEFNLKSKISGVENPSYLAISHDGNHVYAANEVKNGTISSFLFNPSSGELSFVNKVSTGGSSPCYVSVDDKSKFVFAGNYSSGNLAAVSLNDDGSLGTEPQFIKHEGSSIDKGRQQGPHVHCTVLSPDNKYLLTADLGKYIQD